MDQTKYLKKFKSHVEYVISIQSLVDSNEVFLYHSLTENPVRRVTINHSVTSDMPVYLQLAFVITDPNVLKQSNLLQILSNPRRSVHLIKIYALPPYENKVYAKNELSLLHRLTNPTIKSLFEALEIECDD